ncbi:MAG: hypothetical protein MNPFHGCM_00217 [Gemmatimonadaceae bacterium]|nr:hypothetical protein [Gemmatimonadaceae bacterium]
MRTRQSRVSVLVTKPLAPRSVYLWRVLRGFAIAGGAVAAGLLIGAIGYHLTEGLSWLDAMLNAAMLLAGEGPMAPPHTTSGKVFATVYALFSGVLFITAVSVLLAPVAHRFLHRLHLEIAVDEDEA